MLNPARWTLLLFLPLALWPLASQGADLSSGAYNMRGFGAIQCREITRLTQDEFAVTQWVLGFITAMNLTTPDTYDLLGDHDAASAKNWVWAYCRANPQMYLGDAAQAFVMAFQTTRARSAPEPVFPPVPPAVPRLPMPPPKPPTVMVQQAQERLLLLGYNPGYADGVFGPKTRVAISLYQVGKGLPATGELDAATLQALGLR